MSARLSTLLLMWFCLSSLSFAGNEIVVITGHETILKEISLKKLKNIFLRKTLVNESGMRWIPLNLNSEHPLRHTFSQSLFNQHPEDLESYWNTQYFQGISPPYTVASEEAMLRFIAGTPGAIGYIPPCHLDARVQVVFKLKTVAPFDQSCSNPANH